MSTLVIVYTLYSDEQEARRAATDAVEAKLAACANILSPTESHYRWNGVVERQREYPVLFKTTEAGAPALMAHIADNHSYDVPAILSWPAASTPAYALWVQEMTA